MLTRIHWVARSNISKIYLRDINKVQKTFLFGKQEKDLRYKNFKM